MLQSKKLHKILKIMGFDNKKKITFIPVIMNAIGILLILNAFIYLKIKWNINNQSKEYLYLATKDINMLIVTNWYSFLCMFKKNKLNTLFNIINKNVLIYNNILTDTKNNVLNINKKLQNDILNKTGYLCIIIIGFYITSPLFISIYIIYTNNINKSNLIIKDLPLPFIFYFPNGYDTLLIYIITYLLQAVYYLNMLGIIYVIFGSTVCSFRSLIIDTRLFCIEIKEIDIATNYIFNHEEYNSKLISLSIHENSKKLLNNFNYKENRDIELKKYMNHLVNCHQNICR